MAGRSMCLASLLVLAIATGTAAHSCDNGQRVTCTAVRSLPTDKDANSHGKSARGTAHCTPDNQKVYCLVNHNYHGCNGDQQPCCSDGSNPWHSRHPSPSTSDDLTCEQPAMSEENTAPVSLSISKDSTPPPQVILDDMDSTITQGVQAEEGSYAPCMKDAYKGQYHHDWAMNKGRASFTFSFQAPKSGCYRIDEYHPGQDPACSRYMPRNARLDFEINQVLAETHYINQAENSAQWNEIGSHMFSEGQAAKLIMRNSHEEKCLEPPCFWIADAFRLTWTGESCSSQAAMEPLEKTQEKDSQPSMASLEKMQEKDTQPTKAPHLGMLTLQAHLSHDHGHPAIELWLKQHQDSLEMGLATHFGFASVRVLAIAGAGRRLAATDAVTIRFAGQGARPNPSSEGLKMTLQKAFSTASADMTIMDATVEWITTQPTPKDAPGSPITIGSVLIFVCLSLGLLATVGACVMKMKKKASKTGVIAETGEANAEEMGKTEHAYVIDDVHSSEAGKKSEQDAMEVDSVGSTQSPVSDSANVDDTNSWEGKNDGALDDSEDVVVVDITEEEV